jgi:HlyD family secretion protein
MKQTPTLSRIALAGIALLAAGGLCSCAGSDADAPSQTQRAPAPIAVQTTSPQRRNVSRLISLPGEVHPWEEATLYAKVPGYLATITVDKGDRVKAGQLIATIEAPELRADRDQAQQAYEASLSAALGSQAAGRRSVAEQRKARASAEKARADYAQMPATVARAQALVRAAAGAVQQSEEQKRQAEAAVAESMAQIDRARADIDAVQADQKLADLTYARYKGIYDRDALLIARQDVDIAESRAATARSRAEAAQGALEAARRHWEAARAQVGAADSQIEQAQAQLSAAREQVNVVTAQQESAGKQVDIAARDVDIARQQQAVARAGAEEARFQANAGRSAVGKAAAVADYSRIRAPFDGVVTHRFVDRGAFIQTASASQNAAPIVTVANLNPVRLYLSVPETQAEYVQVGTAVSVTTTGRPDTTLRGRVARTSASLDPKTRTLLAEVDIPNVDGKILAGTYASARIVMETHPAVVSVPTAAVGAEKSGKFVYVVESGKARRVPVTTGFDDGVYTEIAMGLHGGEQVVVTGRDALTPNAPVAASAWIAPASK